MGDSLCGEAFRIYLTTNACDDFTQRNHLRPSLIRRDGKHETFPCRRHPIVDGDLVIEGSEDSDYSVLQIQRRNPYLECLDIRQTEVVSHVGLPFEGISLVPELSALEPIVEIQRSEWAISDWAKIAQLRAIGEDRRLGRDKSNSSDGALDSKDDIAWPGYLRSYCLPVIAWNTAL